MNIKTPQILPLGSGGNRYDGCPHHGVSDRSKPRAEPSGGQAGCAGEGSSTGHTPRHRVTVRRLPGTEGSRPRRDKQEGRKGIAITDNLGSLN